MNQGEQGTDKPLDTKLVNKRLKVQVLITQPLTHHFLISANSRWEEDPFMDISRN